MIEAMKKLEFKHLAPYLPYGMKFITQEGKVYDLNANHIFNNHTGVYKGLCNEAKIILHPLSDLTKVIEVNGEKFVPIVELAKIHDKFYEYLSGIAIDKDEECRYFVLNYSSDVDKNILGSFVITEQYPPQFEANVLFENSTPAKYQTVKVNNQLQLFQRLFEWHFDLFRLIPEGLAVDINTLK